MARTNIQVVITVKDGASKPLEGVQRGIKNTGKAAKTATSDIWQFNKTLFSMAAFIGLFSKGFGKLRESITLGAELDKVTTQFERQIGPKSKFMNTLEQSTNVVVDEFTALQVGLKLGNLGLTKSVEDSASTIAKFAVAGRMAGKDATSVIEGLGEAVADGNVAKLEELGIMKKTDPAFMALMAVMNKAGGVMGGVIAKQQAMAIVMGAINKRVQGQMFAFMSLGEIVEYTGKAYGNLKRNVGVLLATAVRPLLEKLLPLIQSFGKIVENVTRTDKHTMFLVKTILALTAAFSGLFAVLGTMKLLVKLLGFTPLGFGGMAVAIVGVTSAFVGLTRSAEGPLGKLKLFGAFFKGIYELVTNFDPETGMSKISAATEKMLGDAGILGFVDFIAASIVTVKATIKDITSFITWSAKKVDEAVGFVFGNINDKLKNTSKWTTWWTTDTLSNFDKVKRAALILGAVFGSIFLGKKIFGAASGLLSKIPGIGGMFGGGKGPKGTASDPIYTRPADGGLGAGLGEGAGGVAKSAGMSMMKAIIANIGIILTSSIPELVLMLGTAGAAAVTALGVGIAGAAGYAVGTLIDKYGPTFKDKNSGGFEGGFIERMMFKASKLTGLGPAAEFAKNQQEYEKNMANSPPGMSTNQAQSGKKTNISVPTLPADQDTIINTLGEQMKSMKDSDKAQFQKAIEDSLNPNSSGGSLISPEEFNNFQNMMIQALDGSKNLTELVNLNKDKKLALRANQRG